MNILKEKLAPIKQALVEAAKNKSVVEYRTIYSLFDKNEEKSTVWDTFEAACEELAPSKVAIYGVLLAIKSTNLPEDGFFEVFQNIHPEEYKKITGKIYSSSNFIPNQQKAKIVAIEKVRVYEHAIKEL